MRKVFRFDKRFKIHSIMAYNHLLKAIKTLLDIQFEGEAVSDSPY